MYYKHVTFAKGCFKIVQFYRPEQQLMHIITYRTSLKLTKKALNTFLPVRKKQTF